MQIRAINLLVVLAFAGCAAPPARDAAEAERYIQTIGGTTAIVERLADYFSAPMWAAGHYDPRSGLVTHDRDGQPTEEWLEHRNHTRTVLLQEIDQSVVHAAMVNSLTNTFSALELKALNDLTKDERSLLWQCASKKHFMQKRTPLKEEHGIPPVGFTAEEEEALERFPAPVLSALDKLPAQEQRFQANVWKEYRRALAVAKQEEEEEGAQPEN